MGCSVLLYGMDIRICFITLPLQSTFIIIIIIIIGLSAVLWPESRIANDMQLLLLLLLIGKLLR